MTASGHSTPTSTGLWMSVLAASDLRLLWNRGLPVIVGLEVGAVPSRTHAFIDGPGTIAVVVITTFDLDEHVYAALKAGARGFLLKDAGPPLLAASVHAAASGGALIAPSITARLLARFADLGGPSRTPSEPLTDREEEVLLTVARGLTNHEIVRELQRRSASGEGREGRSSRFR